MSAIRISDHAKTRAKQRFGITDRQCERWIRDKLRNATLVGEVVNAKGDPALLYTKDGVPIVTTTQRDVVITVLQPQMLPEIHAKVQTMLDRELTKARTTERKTLRQLRLEQALMRIEHAECGLAVLETRSQAKKLALQARMAALDAEITHVDGEVFAAKRATTQVAWSVAAFA